MISLLVLQEPSTLFKTMATCGHTDFIQVPPKLESLIEKFPWIPPNNEIDRSIPRCRLCDLIAAQIREDEAVSAANMRPIWKAEKDIRHTESLIHRGIGKEELESALPGLRKTLDEALEARDEKIIEAWRKHWSIWGPAGEGPEPINEISWEEEGDDLPMAAATDGPSADRLSSKNSEIFSAISWEDDDEPAHEEKTCTHRQC